MFRINACKIKRDKERGTETARQTNTWVRISSSCARVERSSLAVRLRLCGALTNGLLVVI